MGDVIVFVILSIIVILIIRSMRNDRHNQKGCSGNCMSCHQGCHGSRQESTINKQPSIKLNITNDADHF